MSTHPAWVYRCIGVSGEVLYIGHTLGLRQRLAAHHRKAWWPDVACVRSTRFDSWQDAYAAELREIYVHRPKHNKQGNPDFYPGTAVPA